MKKRGHIVKDVLPDSIAFELGIQKGDILLKINDIQIKDIFDYQYLTQDEYLEVTILKSNNEEWILEIEKDYDEELGIEFENNLMDEYHSCSNKCMFCFIDQMPKGMRETLYFKDDDSRLSFLQGNYITLTNMSDEDVDRMIKYHLCPINISVHTTNKELRCKMLNNRFAGKVLNNIEKLYKAGIEMNSQIVLVKGVNDKEELEKSIDDLSKFMPHMKSLSVVPAGITKYREGLYNIELFNKEESLEVIKTIEKWQNILKEKNGHYFVQASDEWYINAGLELPKEERYEGYIQLENGVGMMRLLIDEFDEALEKSLKINDKDSIKRKVTIPTGYLAYDIISSLANKTMKEYKNINVNVVKIRNDFFGETITVTGLITGNDLIKQLKNIDLGDNLLLSCNMLRSGERVFLDDVTLDEVEKSLQVGVNIVKSSGQDLLDCILYGKNDLNQEANANKENFVYTKNYDID